MKQGIAIKLMNGTTENHDPVDDTNCHVTAHGITITTGSHTYEYQNSDISGYNFYKVKEAA